MAKSFSLITKMDLITKTPGLIHIAEQIFSNLERNDLLQCQEVNEYWGSILRNPWFWYDRMLKNSTLPALPQEHRKEWRDFCEKLSKSNLTKDMTLGLNLIYEELEQSRSLNWTYWSGIPRKYKKCHFSLNCKQRIEIVKIMSPFMENPNAPDRNGWTPIHKAARYGHTEIVKILAPLSDKQSKCSR